MINNSYYSQDIHGPYELHDIGNLDLEEGGTIRNCQLAYASFGALNAAKDNAILIPTWYSGTNKIIEQVFIGKGRALDPARRAARPVRARFARAVALCALAVGFVHRRHGDV